MFANRSSSSSAPRLANACAARASAAAFAEGFCEEAIYKYEPRVSKGKAKATIHPDEPNRLDLRIEYVIAGKHDKRNLVFPFYLRTAEENAKEP